MTHLWSFVREVYAEWDGRHAPRWAAAVAYHTLFSLAPVLIIAISLAGILFGADAARGEVMAQIAGIMDPQTAEAVQDLLRGFQSVGKSASAVALGTAVLLWGASNLFLSLRDSLDFLWDLGRKNGAGWKGRAKDRLVSLALVLGVGFTLLASLVFSAVLIAFRKALGPVLPLPSWGLHLVDLGLSLALIALLFALIFKFLPSARPAWRDAVTGGTAAAALFIAGKSLLSLYLGGGGVASAYGAAGSVVLILLWVNYSAQVLFIGACVIKVAARRSGRGWEKVSG